ncbi:ATP-binding protein [Stappia sp.]|uniref:AAA family ATPase n=1 Tax=Stappia sp. TaxID=1870903 RepID=UPI0032D91518
MHVTRATINNIRIIDDFEFALDSKTPAAGWHVFLGDNGSGKSTVVRSIVLALIGAENAAASRQDWNGWLRENVSAGSIALSVRQHAKHDRWSGNGRTSQNAFTVRVNMEKNDATSLVETSFQKGSNGPRTVWGNGKGWFSAAFGPFRRFRGGDREYDRLYYSHPKLAPHLSAFGEDVALSEALEWVRTARFKALEDDAVASSLVQGITEFFNASDLLPHGARIHGVTADGIMIDNGDGAVVPIEEMSDGYRSVLSMTLEILRAMDTAYGRDTFLAALKRGAPTTIDLPGVVLIDEVDAHLHPTWQERIGEWFIASFPEVQFLVTTHSPIICRAARNNSIWRLATPGSDEPSRRIAGKDFDRLVNGNLTEAYGTEHFGRDVERSEASGELLKELANLNRREMRGQLDKADAVRLTELRSILPTTATTI